MDRSKRRKSHPGLEGLEGRRLLSGSQNHAVHAASFVQAVTSQFNYTTPQGSKVHLQVTGGGNLNGTTVNADGSLNLVFSGTSVFSTITGTVKGGTGQVPLATLRNANVAFGSTTGVGGELIGRVLLPSFNLISDGNVNLTAGVQVFSLNSVAANSQVHLRDTPLNTTLGLQSYVDTITGAGLSFQRISSSSTGATSTSASGLSSGTAIGATSGSSTGSSSSGVDTVGAGTLDPEALGFGGGAVGAINGAIPIINTVGNGENFLGTPGLSQTQVSFGRSLTYTSDAAGGTQLTGIAGAFVPGSNLIEPRDISTDSQAVPPPGIIVTIKHVNGGGTVKSPPLGDAVIFGYDGTTNSLIKFDATNGSVLQTIALPAAPAGTTVGGVALARDGAEQVVLVGVGTNVLAYDASTGAAVGGFSITSLAGEGLTAITGIGTGNQTTVLSDSNSDTTGVFQTINVAGSLQTGQVVAVGTPYSPAREFTTAGGLTGIPGTGHLYALGAAHFDTAQPNVVQAGILTVDSTAGTISESARTVLTSTTTGLDVPANPNGTIQGDASPALGSLESNLALDMGVVNGVNLISLLNPATLAKQGSITLDDANPLSDLSESFHPEITNSALIDVQGNIQSFTASTVQNAIINDAGNFNLLTVNQATNTTVIGLPFSHVNVPIRNNVVIETNSRLVGTRGGVVVNPNAMEVGPLNLP